MAKNWTSEPKVVGIFNSRHRYISDILKNQTRTNDIPASSPYTSLTIALGTEIQDKMGIDPIGMISRNACATHVAFGRHVQRVLKTPLLQRILI